MTSAAWHGTAASIHAARPIQGVRVGICRSFLGKSFRAGPVQLMVWATPSLISSLKSRSTSTQVMVGRPDDSSSHDRKATVTSKRQLRVDKLESDNATMLSSCAENREQRPWPTDGPTSPIRSHCEERCSLGDGCRETAPTIQFNNRTLLIAILLEPESACEDKTDVLAVALNIRDSSFHPKAHALALGKNRRWQQQECGGYRSQGHLPHASSYAAGVAVRQLSLGHHVKLPRLARLSATRAAAAASF